MTIRSLFLKHKEWILYMLWGAATTAVNYTVYFLCTRQWQIHYIAAQALAWIAAVLFAFWSNKHFVFESKSWRPEIAAPEFCKFVSARLFSGLLETGILWLCVDLWQMHDGVVKVLSGVLVITLNYVFSKLFIFTRRKENG